MGLPARGVRPTASQVVDWCLGLVRKRTGVDVDGSYGRQCWDLPAYITKFHFGGWTLQGHAKAFAYANLPSYLKRYRNTTSFIPKPGDFAVWQGGPFATYGHVAIVISATQSSFVSVDQNWRNPSMYQTGPATKENHSYNYVTHFIRPDYKSEPKTTSPTPTPSPTPKTEDANKNVESGTKPKWVDVTKITYSKVDEDSIDVDNIHHYVVEGKKRVKQATGITIRNNLSMHSVRELYTDRRKYTKDYEYPHYYIDANRLWSPRHVDYEVPTDPNNIVIEVCEDFSASDVEFQLNEYSAMFTALWKAKELNLKLDKNTLKVDKLSWRTVLEHTNWDMTLENFPTNDIYQKTALMLMELSEDIKNLEVFKPKFITQKFRIKSTSTSTTQDSRPVDTKTSGTSTPTPVKSKITRERSPYTFTTALNKQMNVWPQVNYGSGWYNASRNQTSTAMNPTTIQKSGTQRYQMLDLGKYQGIPVSKLNQILNGKGSLHGQGQAFAQAGKQHRVNEIYLIAHAILETGNGRSYFASGRAGVYNMYGIGAYDSNPNYAITYARNQGWTTPSKAIIGGAKFVRSDFINVGQNTLYRMRWNPKAPATHQYATDINWCSHQASTIKKYYDQIGLKGEFFTYDSYR